jgi:hypothetical protein
VRRGHPFSAVHASVFRHKPQPPQAFALHCAVPCIPCLASERVGMHVRDKNKDMQVKEVHFSPVTASSSPGFLTRHQNLQVMHSVCHAAGFPLADLLSSSDAPPGNAPCTSFCGNHLRPEIAPTPIEPILESPPPSSSRTVHQSRKKEADGKDERQDDLDRPPATDSQNHQQ